MFRAPRRLLIALVALLVAVPAGATNGYFFHGYGTKYKALAGAGTALYLGPMAIANNPATLAFGNPGYDATVSLFSPSRSYTVTGDPSGAPSTLGLAPGEYESNSDVSFIPSIAATRYLNEDETVMIGIAGFGNGQMNTDYPLATFDPGASFPDTNPTGMDLTQMFLAPAIAFSLGERHAFGLSPILAYQRFDAKGLAPFGAMGSSSNIDKLSNNDYASSFGYGTRVGYLGELLDFFSVGFSYQTKIAMGEFDEYSGLFAEAGDFDIPANWTAGVMMGFYGMGIAFDVQHIAYSDVASIGNPLLPNLNNAQLGDAAGAGLGWEDMTIFKGGAWYMTNAGNMFRLGYSHGNQPVPESEVLLGILAPGVVEKHLTFGVSKVLDSGREFSFSLMRGLWGSVSGPNPLEAPGQQTIELSMDQWEFGFGVTF
ncbi:MAG: hypothetical protein HKN21_07885 [Candidatus Eisenbacteria bacterium]|uniref:Long-chain fatty acid transporter n=1 Tax=Eiseniibacteriota bacterium TaxID=2212470 RepID=A0A7Y2H249_UNCEI|nr:hypothetical protein [Candidatus Eisenbacteria bacterium]